MKTFAKATIVAFVVLNCLFLGVLGYGVFDAVSSGKNVVIEVSDGAVVKITNGRKNAVEFISGTGGVSAFAPSLVPLAGAIFVLISSFAVFGSCCLFRGNAPAGAGLDR